MEVPMLDEEEYKIASKLYRDGFQTGKCSMTRKKRFKDLLDYYKDLTGFEETNPNAIMHHRIDLYGSACENCSKPYRTPKASLCAACGNKRASVIINYTEILHQAAPKWWQRFLILNRAE